MLVPIPLPSGRRLDYKDIHKAETKWNPVDTIKAQLEDLDFAEDVALLSHSHQQMQEKTSELAAISSRVALNVHKGKTKSQMKPARSQSNRKEIKLRS